VLPKAIGLDSFVTTDARQFAEWGLGYLKSDWIPVELPEAGEIADALRIRR
jgi:alpha-galactosidase